jgi:hypothetical protein
MRVVVHVLLSFCLLLGTPLPARAGDTIKIEIAETTLTLGLVPHTFPGSPETIQTHCDVLIDVNCNSTVTPATSPSSGLLPEILLFEAKAILPNGSHVELMCSPSRWNKKCKGIKPSGGTRPESVKCYFDAIAAFAADASGAAGNTKSCATKNLGFYRAKYSKDGVLVYTPDGKLEYRVAGTW